MKHKNTNREYAFLMIEYEMPEFIKDIQDKISPEELYYEDGNDDYGIEIESHVTLVPCLDNDINIDELKKYLEKIGKYEIMLSDISKFECENFDVLKCNVMSDILKKTNKAIVDNFDTHSEYKVYQPHLTIAYMKKGMADKYTKDILDKLIYLKPKNFHFSYVENGKEKDIRFD